MVTIFTYLKNPASCLSDFLQPYSNESENKNKPASCLWSISDRTNASTGKIYTSYESPDTPLLWAQGTRAWHTHVGHRPMPTFTSLKICYIFSFWGLGGHVRLMKWKDNVLYQVSLYQDLKNHWILNTVSLHHEKMFVWNASIWVDGPCSVKKFGFILSKLNVESYEQDPKYQKVFIISIFMIKPW